MIGKTAPNRVYYLPSSVKFTGKVLTQAKVCAKLCHYSQSCPLFASLLLSVSFFSPTLLIFCSLSASSNTFPLYPSSGSFNLPFLQPTTAASRSCRPSLMSGPLNCRLWATRSSIRVRPASIWPVDQSTGRAGRMVAGRGSLPCVQVMAS